MAWAREEYRWTSVYATDTAAEQAGLTEEERAEAERVASGEAPDDGVEEKPPDADLAARLQAQIEEQRAAEQELRAQAVAAAEAEAEAKRLEAARLAEAQEQAAAEAAAKQ